jgi:hypothetical protein
MGQVSVTQAKVLTEPSLAWKRGRMKGVVAMYNIDVHDMISPIASTWTARSAGPLLHFHTLPTGSPSPPFDTSV